MEVGDVESAPRGGEEESESESESEAREAPFGGVLWWRVSKSCQIVLGGSIRSRQFANLFSNRSQDAKGFFSSRMLQIRAQLDLLLSS